MSTNNPFTSANAIVNSNYYKTEGNEVIQLSHKKESEGDKDIIKQIQNHIEGEKFPCLAAKASFNTHCNRIGIYKELGNEDVSEGLGHDLVRFLYERQELNSNFTSFIAVFKESEIESELDFEALLWKQLRLLSRLSSSFYDWDPSVSSNPEDDNFGFSFGGKAFFVVGMHPHSSRLSRQTHLPLIVFNPHEQFEYLKKTGKYEGLKQAIRKRDIELQGIINPALSDFGTESEAKQYAGRKVEKKWKCPFH